MKWKKKRSQEKYNALVEKEKKATNNKQMWADGEKSFVVMHKSFFLLTHLAIRLSYRVFSFSLVI